MDMELPMVTTRSCGIARFQIIHRVSSGSFGNRVNEFIFSLVLLNKESTFDWTMVVDGLIKESEALKKRLVGTRKIQRIIQATAYGS